MNNLSSCVIVALILIIIVLYWTLPSAKSMVQKKWTMDVYNSIMKQEKYIPDSEQLYNAGPAFPPPYNMNGLLTSVRTGDLL